MFYFFAGTSPQRFEEVIAELNLEVARVQQGGVTAEELKRCQTRLKAGKRMGMQTNSSRAMQATLNAIYGLPINEWRTYDARIDGVKLVDLQSFALKYFQLSQRVHSWSNHKTGLARLNLGEGDSCLVGCLRLG